MDEQAPDLADLAEHASDASTWDAWLTDHPEEAVEVEIARRVRAFMIELQRADIAVPADFQERLMLRIRQDATLLHLLDLGLGGLGHAILELLAAFFAFLPAPRPQAAT